MTAVPLVGDVTILRLAISSELFISPALSFAKTLTVVAVPCSIVA